MAFRRRSKGKADVHALAGRPPWSGDSRLTMLPLAEHKAKSSSLALTSNPEHDCIIPQKNFVMISDIKKLLYHTAI